LPSHSAAAADLPRVLRLPEPLNGTAVWGLKQSVDAPALPLYTYSLTMKKELHPKTYRDVVFQDLNNGTTYLTRSTVAAEDKITLDGKEYPLVKVHISSSSHPFFTGEERILDIEGRVDKFKARQEAAKARSEALKKAAQKKHAPRSRDSNEAQKLGK
jgi:large subunit ribosomal protein L31